MDLGQPPSVIEENAEKIEKYFVAWDQ